MLLPLVRPPSGVQPVGMPYLRSPIAAVAGPYGHVVSSVPHRAMRHDKYLDIESSCMPPSLSSKTYTQQKKGEQIAATDRHQHNKLDPTTDLPRRR